MSRKISNKMDLRKNTRSSASLKLFLINNFIFPLISYAKRRKTMMMKNLGKDGKHFCFLHDVTTCASWRVTYIVFHRNKAHLGVNDASSAILVNLYTLVTKSSSTENQRAIKLGRIRFKISQTSLSTIVKRIAGQIEFQICLFPSTNCQPENGIHLI